MSGYEARCPSCGGEIVFQLGASLLKVCEHCGTAVARRGADIVNYGKVAALLPTSTVLKRGLRGDYEGAPPFQLVGHLQLDWGSGAWDEWLMGFEDGSWAWLSEAQGRYHYMGQAAVPPVPAFDDIRPGHTIDLGPPGTFVVSEVRKARFAAAEGELPFDVKPGMELHYADLQGPGGQLATIDYGTGDTAEALYVGREVTLADLRFEDLPEEADRRKRVAGEGLKCPQCAGPIELRAPDATQRVGCPWCGSLLDASKDFKVLQALKDPGFRPTLPLGTKGTFREVEWQVIGAMERSVTVEGVRYPWREYLLYHAKHGFRWLVDAKGHWSFVEPLSAGDIADLYGQPVYEGQKFSHFQSGTARVDHVLGEFYWTVARGDETETDDYVAPPRMVSKESTREEVTWNLGTYAKPKDVWEAFSLEGEPPEPEGVGPHQPFEGEKPGGLFLKAVMGSGLVLLLFLFLVAAGGKTLHKQSIPVAATAVSGTPESVTFAGPFQVTSSGNLQVRLTAPVSNSWLYVDGALINEETGAVDEFDVEVAYYSGYDSDGAWSEGGQSATRYIGSVPPGRYMMRLAPQWEARRAPSAYDVAVRSRVPRFWHACLAMLALFAWPLLALWRWFRFEAARWSESDHPWVESSSEEE